MLTLAETLVNPVDYFELVEQVLPTIKDQVAAREGVLTQLLTEPTLDHAGAALVKHSLECLRFEKSLFPHLSMLIATASRV